MAGSDQPPSSAIATQLKKPSLTELLDEVITIILENGKQIYIHKGLLCHHSPVFRAMLKHDWKEKQEKIVTLKYEKKNGPFKRFMLWLYYGTAIDNDETIESIPMQTPMDCYFLADRWDVPAMQNNIVDTIIRKAQAIDRIPCGSQRYIWENTPEQSPLRKLLEDMTVLRGNIPGFVIDEKENDVYDKSFILDVLLSKYTNPNTIS
ncbi:MAG: hypothetical protein Q9221_000577 [Calogaya cf. arnoldii]